MSEMERNDNPLANASHEDVMSALFANLVMQQSQMALMFLGKMPNPQTGETIQDTEMAQLFIDNLEMLEIKTKGNLDNREEKLLKDSLTAVRMAFVEAVQTPKSESPKEEKAAPAEPTAQGTAGQATPSPDPAAEAESRKKFTKKY